MKYSERVKSKFISKKESRGHSAWIGLQSKTKSKNPMFDNLN